MIISERAFINVGMPRTKRKTDREVLDALLPTILVVGIDRVTLKEMGAVVELSASTLLQRFGSRMELIEAALDRSTDMLEQTLAEPRPDGVSAQEGLVRWLADLAHPISDRRLLVGSFQVLGRDILVEARNGRARRHLGLVRRRIETGLIEMGFDSASAGRNSVLVEAHWHGLVLQWAVHGEGPLDTWVRDGVLRLLEHLSPD